MREASVQLFESYLEKCNGAVDRALAETVQSIALLGLSRSGFFSDAAFYGGTALRLLYHLDRFSEDLDFSLTSPNKAFSFGAFLSPLRDELQAFGFTVDIQEHRKKQASPIASAFIKANTRIHLMKVNVPRVVTDRIHRDALCKVKVEVHIDPPPDAVPEVSKRCFDLVRTARVCVDGAFGARTQDARVPSVHQLPGWNPEPSVLDLYIGP
jgi:predicted nucleotidyltransferase component of viral defense system